MSKINSKINPKSADFVSNTESMQAQVDDLNATIAKIRQGGGAKACDRHISRGKLLPRDRVQGLFRLRVLLLALAESVVRNVSSSPMTQPLRVAATTPLL